MTGTTPATPPTDRSRASSSQHTHRVTRRTPSSNRMGRPTRRVVTVLLLLLLGGPFCGSSATIPQPPPVTTRHERSSWSAVVASFFGRSPITLSSHSNNVVVNADDADGTTIPPPSPSPSSVKAHSDTKALLHQLTLLSECHGHDGDCTTMSLFSSLLALTIPILKHGGVILREVVSGSTTLSSDNGSVVAVTDDAVDTFVTVVLDTDDDAAVTVVPLPPPLMTATATATVEHTEDTTLSSDNESVAADTDDDAAVPVVPVPSLLVTKAATAEHTEDTTLSSDNESVAADTTVERTTETEATELPPPIITATTTTFALLLLIIAATILYVEQRINQPRSTSRDDRGREDANDKWHQLKQLGRHVISKLITFDGWHQLKQLGRDVNISTLITFVAMIIIFVIAFAISFVIMVYTWVHSLWAQRPGQQDDMPPRRAITERPTGRHVISTMMTFFHMIVLTVIAAAISFIIIPDGHTGSHAISTMLTFFARLVFSVIVVAISYELFAKKVVEVPRYLTPSTFVDMIICFVIAFAISLVLMAYTLVQYLWAQRPITGPPIMMTPSAHPGNSVVVYNRNHDAGGRTEFFGFKLWLEGLLILEGTKYRHNVYDEEARQPERENISAATATPSSATTSSMKTSVTTCFGFKRGFLITKAPGRTSRKTKRSRPLDRDTDAEGKPATTTAHPTTSAATSTTASSTKTSVTTGANNKDTDDRTTTISIEANTKTVPHGRNIVGNIREAVASPEVSSKNMVDATAVTMVAATDDTGPKKRSARNQITKEDYNNEGSDDNDEDSLKEAFKRAPTEVLEKRKIYKVKRYVVPNPADASSENTSKANGTNETTKPKPPTSANSTNPFAATSFVVGEKLDKDDNEKRPFNAQWFCRKLHRRRLHWTARFPARPRIMRRSARYHEDDFERSIDYKNGFVVRRRIPRMPVGVGVDVDVDVDVDGPPIVGGEDLQLEQENIYSLPSFVVTEPPIMTTPNQGVSEHSFIRRKPNPKRGIDPKELESLAVVLPYPTLADLAFASGNVISLESPGSSPTPPLQHEGRGQEGGGGGSEKKPSSSSTSTSTSAAMVSNSISGSGRVSRFTETQSFLSRRRQDEAGYKRR